VDPPLDLKLNMAANVTFLVVTRYKLKNLSQKSRYTGCFRVVVTKAYRDLTLSAHTILF